ncbi:MAG: hypothetical protein PWQ25_2234 [Deferribacteres bacterium]|jgi:hypothetical protein|nr:hypothetical protein [Deferribacteres bacterium]
MIESLHTNFIYVRLPIQVSNFFEEILENIKNDLLKELQRTKLQDWRNCNEKQDFIRP